MSWHTIFSHRWLFFSSTNLVSIMLEFLYYYHTIHDNVCIIPYSVFKYTNFRYLRKWVLVFAFNEYVMPFKFSFVFFIFVYSSGTASAVHIFVVNNSFWLLCHIYLGAAASLSASAVLTGVVAGMDGWSAWLQPWHTQANKLLIFFCLLNKSCRTN